jgi:hypothetical protein
MTTKGTFALAASTMAFFAISGAAYAGTVSLKKHRQVEHRKLFVQAPTEVRRAFDSASQQATEYNTLRYHGGPKSND